MFLKLREISVQMGESGPETFPKVNFISFLLSHGVSPWYKKLQIKNVDYSYLEKIKCHKIIRLRA